MALVAAALALAYPARAGTLLVEDGPNFTPEGSFTNNTIEVDTTIGEGALIHIIGSATVTPPEGSDVVSIDVSGDVKWEMTGTRATGAAAHDQSDESATGLL